MRRLVFSVSQINNYVKRILDRDALLSNVFVQGEISNLKFHSSGHIYFTLKDGGAQLSCVMFSSYAETLMFMPENGLKITVCGSISLYEKTGSYQLYTRIMEPSGIGALYVAFERLKNRLGEEGLFDIEHKKPLPPYPKTVAVITSPTGAAVRDIITVSGRRNPSVELVVIPCLVQGEVAADSIVSAIETVNKWKGADVIILGRGGGSIEDLWAFNEEKVARAIYKSEIPIISAVGHETDYTIADFAADLRAATPSAAAEIAVKRSDDLNNRIVLLQKKLDDMINLYINSLESSLDSFKTFFVSERRTDKVCDSEIYLSRLFGRLNEGFDNRLIELTNKFEKNAALLNSLSPLRVSERGYVIVTDKNSDVIVSAKALSVGDRICLNFKDGRVNAVIGDTNG